MSSYYSQSNSFHCTIGMASQSQQPQDTVQCIRFNPARGGEKGFGAVGWDGVFRYYEVRGNGHHQAVELVVSQQFPDPISSFDYAEGSIVVIGLVTGAILAMDLANTGNIAQIGDHGSLLSKVFWVQRFGEVCSIGQDAQIFFWSLRPENFNKPIRKFDFPCDIHTAAYDFPYLLVGTADAKVEILNLDRYPELRIPDSTSRMSDALDIGSKFTCSFVSSRLKKYALGACDGRLCIGKISDSYSNLVIEKPDIVSKSNKKESSYQNSPVYGMVNDIFIGEYSNCSFLLLSGTEEMCIYNLEQKDKTKRIKGTVTVGQISLDGGFIAYAEGKDWCEGLNDLKKNAKSKISVIKLTPTELQASIASKR